MSFILLLTHINPDVLCITETFATSSYVDLFFHLPGYFLLRQDRIVRGGGGIIIYIRNGLSYQLDSTVAHTSGLWEAIVCTVFSPFSSPLRILCFYRSPGPMTPPALNDFIEYFQNFCALKNDLNAIILGDFNLPKINWEINLCNSPVGSPANLFLSAVVSNNLFQMVDFPTRYLPGQIPSLLDLPSLLVLIHDELFVQSLTSLPGIGKSDHVMLSITVHFSYELKFNQNIKLNFHKADFQLFNSMIEAIDWHNELSGLNCDEALEILNCFLLTLCHNLIPKTKFSLPRSSKAPWMTRDIKKLVNKKKRLWDVYKSNPTEASLQNFKSTRNSLTNKIRKRKSEFESNLVSDCRSCPKKLFAYINAKKKTQPLASLKVNNKIINDDSGIAEALREYFHSTFDTTSVSPKTNQQYFDDDFVPFFFQK